jgi:hypothetical protein
MEPALLAEYSAQSHLLYIPALFGQGVGQVGSRTFPMHTEARDCGREWIAFMEEHA